MTSRLLAKLIKSPIPKLNSSQVKENTLCTANIQNNNYSSIDTEKNKKEQAAVNEPKNAVVERNKAFPLKLQGVFAKHLQFLSLSPDVLFIKSVTADYISLIQREMSLKHIRNILSGNFSTSSNHSRFWDKFMLHEGSVEATKIKPGKPKLEIQPVVLQGVGWAGQPVVMRIHPIQPEVFNQRCDIFTALKELPINKKATSHTIKVTEEDKVSQSTKDLYQRESGQNGKISDNRSELKSTKVHTSITNTKTLVDTSESIKKDYFTVDDSQRVDNNHASSEIKEKNLKTTVDILPMAGLKHKKNLSYKKVKGILSGLDVPRQKKGIKTKIGVSDRKSVNSLKINKVQKKKNNKFKSIGISKKTNYLDSPFLLNPLAHNQVTRKSVMHVEKRQFKTYSPENQANLSLKTHSKDQSSSIMGTKQSSKKKVSNDYMEGKFPEDCECPVTAEIKNKFVTNICGEAANAEEKKKKKKERKQKMCTVERKIKQKKKTFVCAPIEKFSKTKRKRQLPKCPKPEKKVAPRVEVCPPVLIDEEKERQQQKKCVKQVEEVKERKRTKVCKSVFIQAKEEAAVVVEKQVCVEKKVQQKKSRHTTVCAPPSEDDKRSVARQ